MKDTIIISGFPGIGKSYFCRKSDLDVSDSDSSLFPKRDFPNNYISHIKSLIGHKDFILVSSHKEVRDALTKSGIEFKLIYPSRDQKQDYVNRYKERGSSDSFIKLLESNFDMWVYEMSNQRSGDHIVLKKGQYLSDIFPCK